MNGSVLRVLADEAATLALGETLAGVLVPGLVIHLCGDLGAGKTTLARGLLRGLGHQGPVRSPTYTLMEPYDAPGLRCLHLDLYRLSDPEELDYLGLREELNGDVVVLVEWPERGGDALPSADLRITLEDRGEGRTVMLEPRTFAGERMLAAVRAS